MCWEIRSSSCPCIVPHSKKQRSQSTRQLSSTVLIFLSCLNFLRSHVSIKRGCYLLNLIQGNMQKTTTTTPPPPPVYPPPPPPHSESNADSVRSVTLDDDDPHHASNNTMSSNTNNNDNVRSNVYKAGDYDNRSYGSYQSSSSSSRTKNTVAIRPAQNLTIPNYGVSLVAKSKRSRPTTTMF
jgi:hypothetical protein